MSSVSLFEQLTSSVSLSILGIISTAILVLLLVYNVACRTFFSTSKSKDNSSNKDKKSNTKKQQDETTSANKKRNRLTNTQSEESENEKATTLVASTKKSTPPSKVSTGKKLVAGENNKISVSTNEIKTSSTKQQAPVRAENVEGKKQSKTGASNQQQTSEKSNAVTKVNTTNSNKKQPIVVNSEAKRTVIVDGEIGNDQEDEGQWLTQGNKQINNRHRNKGKTESSNTNHQTSPSALSNRNVASEKGAILTPTTDKNESDVEPTIPLEPIELYQLLPTNENRYTANDNWWKQALNKQQTFSIDDIGEWPEREQDEQYTVQIKRIIPVNEEQDD